MLKPLKELVEVIEDNINIVTDNRNTVVEIKEELNKYGILGGRIEQILNNTGLLFEFDSRIVMLFAEQIYLKTGNLELEPERWYTKYEIDEARQYFEDNISNNEIKEISFENVQKASNGLFVTTIDVKTLAQLMKAQVLNYNFDIQRQASHKKRHGAIIEVPTVYKQNVKEIEDLLLKGELVTTAIALNTATRTSNSGQELIYDEKTKILTISEGTRIDILDGFHRCLGSLNAYNKNPNIDFKFALMISNFTTQQAQQYQAQLAKATPIPKARQMELEASRLADDVVQQLRTSGELRGRISSSPQISSTAGELVSYSVISNAIEREFPMKRIIDTYEVSEWLTEFFNYLIGLNYEEFLGERRKDSLMSYNKMFAGYIALAAKMKEKNIDILKLRDIIKNIDFSKSNPIWQQIGILDEYDRIYNSNGEAKIVKFFRGLELNRKGEEII